MNGGALDDALETRRRLGLAHLADDHAGEFAVDELGQIPAQLLDIHAAGAQYGHRVLVLGQGKQKVLERGVFVKALGGQRQGAVQGLLEIR